MAFDLLYSEPQRKRARSVAAGEGKPVSSGVSSKAHSNKKPRTLSDYRVAVEQKATLEALPGEITKTKNPRSSRSNSFDDALAYPVSLSTWNGPSFAHLDPSLHLLPYPPSASLCSSHTLSIPQPESPSPLNPLPLTEANLRKLDSESPMATSVQSQSSASTSPTEVWRNLERNHIHDNDPHGAELGADIIAGAETVINGFRNSTTTAEEQQDIKLTVRSYKKATKLSFLVTLWSVLLNMDRQVKQNLTDEEWVTRAWVKDGLRATWQERFNSKTVHQLDFHLDGWPEWNKVPKVKTPYPDITYGYHHESCTQAMRSVESGFAANMCKDVAFPWFVVEAKSANEPIEAAEMQCARAGAAIVYQLRKLFNDMQIESAKHEQPTSSPPPSSEPHKFPYADPSAIAFTLAVAPSKAHLSVHFVEQHTATQPHYHMHLIGSYDFNRPAAYKDLRKHINNIFDWGLKERKQDIEKRCEEYSKIVRLSKMKRKADS